MSARMRGKVGSFEILAPIGAGGMGQVYRARDTRLGRDVAIKVLSAGVVPDASHLARFEQEARAASALNHPNIVTVYEVGEVDGLPFIAMELVEGKPVSELVSGGPMTPKRALDVAAQIADGLAKAHESGIVHRDLKPDNVMVSRDGFVKILDFGLAKLVEEGLPPPGSASGDLLTRPGTIVGTPSYMSPEQARGDRVDFRSDQFAFGAVLYEMLTGKRAFARATPVQTLSSVLEDEPVAAAELNPRIPVPLRWILDRCLAKEPEERYASTRDLAKELRTVRERLSETMSSGDTAAFPAQRRRWHPAPAIVGLAAGLAVGAVAALLLSRGRRSESPVLRTLTYSGHDRSPSVSRDGRLMAFTSDRELPRRIWLKQLASGGDEVALTHGPDDSPRLSPDGSAVLFAREADGAFSLFRAPVVGGEARKLVAGAREGDWSPDGSRIAFVRILAGERSGSSLAVISGDGQGETEIARVDGRQLLAPRFSPDGRFIAATSRTLQGPSPDRIEIFAAEGGKDSAKARRSLAPPRAFFISAVAWSGRGDAIVYALNDAMTANVSGELSRVVRQDVRSGRVETLLFAPTLGMSVEVAGRSRVVFDALAARENLREVVGAGESRWLTRGQSHDRQPAYAPDGDWVVFSSNRSGNLDLWEVSTKSGAVRRLTFDEAEDWDPAFTPDGRRILWSSNRSGHFEVWSIDRDGSGPRQVTADGVDAENPTQTRDGRFIVYNSGNPGKSGIWRIRPDGSEAKQLVAGQTLRPEVSPDGLHAVFQTDLLPESVTIRVVRLADGVLLPFRLSVKGPPNVTGRCRFLPDGSAIAFVGPNEKGVYGVFASAFHPERDAGPPRPLAGFDAESAAESFGVSPDGARLTIAGREQVFSIVEAARLPGIEPPSAR